MKKEENMTLEREDVVNQLAELLRIYDARDPIGLAEAALRLVEESDYVAYIQG